LRDFSWEVLNNKSDTNEGTLGRAAYREQQVCLDFLIFKFGDLKAFVDMIPIKCEACLHHSGFNVSTGIKQKEARSGAS
jgi:hypothetical protein